MKPFRFPASLRIDFPGRRTLAFRLAGILAIVAGITLVASQWLPVNATTVGFLYLVAILIIATRWGFIEATVASILAVLCFNYFFFPPVGTFTIADPQNWVALFAFLATSIIGSRLSAHAKYQASEALDRESEMEKLYALSRAILLTDFKAPVTEQIAGHAKEIFDFTGVALYDCRAGESVRFGSPADSLSDEGLRQAATEQGFSVDQSAGALTLPIRLGNQPVGSLAILGRPLSSAALQALSNLIAIGLERARGQKAASCAEAARQSEKLKSTLLDAIAHEFKTPLTSIKAASTALLSAPPTDSEPRRELITIIDEEATRLGRLVSEAIQMARFDGGKVQLNLQTQTMDNIIRPVIEQLKARAEGRRLVVTLDRSLPAIVADGELLRLALRQILDNALKYSPPPRPFTIHAGRADNAVVITVSDEGTGIPPGEQARIFEKFYRGRTAGAHITGTGMGLAIALEIVRAHGGDIRVESEPGKGASFSVMLPLAPEEEIV